MKKVLLLLLLPALLVAQEMDAVFLVTKANYPDALAIASASVTFGIPVLFTEKERIPRETLAVLDKIKPETIYMIGGPLAISDDVEAQLEQMNYQVIRIWGNTRYETSAEIATYFWDSSDVAIVAYDTWKRKGEFFKTLSVAKALASAYGAPTLLVGDALPEAVANALVELGVGKVMVVGQVPSEVIDSIQELGIKVERLSEEDAREEAIKEAPERVIHVVCARAKVDVIPVASPRAGRFFAVFIVRSEEDLNIVMDFASEHGIGKIFVTGIPWIAEKVAEILRNQGFEVELVTGDPLKIQKEYVEKNMDEWKEVRARIKERIHRILARRIKRMEKILEIAEGRFPEEVRKIREMLERNEFQNAVRKAWRIASKVKKELFREGRLNEIENPSPRREELRERILKVLRKRMEKVRSALTKMMEEGDEELKKFATSELQKIEELMPKLKERPSRELIKELAEEMRKVTKVYEEWKEEKEEEEGEVMIEIPGKVVRIRKETLIRGIVPPGLEIAKEVVPEEKVRALLQKLKEMLEVVEVRVGKCKELGEWIKEEIMKLRGIAETGDEEAFERALRDVRMAMKKFRRACILGLEVELPEIKPTEKEEVVWPVLVLPTQCANPWDAEGMSFEEWLKSKGVEFKEITVLRPRKRPIVCMACQCWAGYFIRVTTDLENAKKIIELLKKHKINVREGIWRPEIEVEEEVEIEGEIEVRGIEGVLAQNVPLHCEFESEEVKGELWVKGSKIRFEVETLLKKMVTIQLENELYVKIDIPGCEWLRVEMEKKEEVKSLGYEVETAQEVITPAITLKCEIEEISDDLFEPPEACEIEDLMPGVPEMPPPGLPGGGIGEGNFPV